MESNLVVEKVVEGKFGMQVKDINGDYYSFGKFYSGPKSFDAGTNLKVELYVTERGTKYINKVLESVSGVDKLSGAEPKRRGRPAKVSNGNGSETPKTESLSTLPAYKPRDYDKEARGKTRCAAMVAILSPMLPILVTNPQNLDEVKEKAKELADFAVNYSFQEDN